MNHKPNCQMSSLGWAATVPPVCTCHEPSKEECKHDERGFCGNCDIGKEWARNKSPAQHYREVHQPKEMCQHTIKVWKGWECTNCHETMLKKLCMCCHGGGGGSPQPTSDWEERLRLYHSRHLGEGGGYCPHCATIDNALSLLSQSRSSLLEEVRGKINEVKIITPEVEPPPNKLSQNQIFGAGQMNMKSRIDDILTKLIK